MPGRAEQALAEFEQQIGVDTPPGAVHFVDQEQIDAFALATLDRQFIHVDPRRAAAESPFPATIAHGFLTLSLIPHLVGSIPPYDPDPFAGRLLTINYGLDRVRFPAPVIVNSPIRARRRLLAAELRTDTAIHLKFAVTVEIEGEEKPASVAECLTRVVYPD